MSGGEGGIRTLGTGFSPYNGLANRRIRPLCHLSGDRFLQSNMPSFFRLWDLSEEEGCHPRPDSGHREPNYVDAWFIGGA